MDEFKRKPVSIGTVFTSIALVLLLAFLLVNERIQRPFAANGIYDTINLAIDSDKAEVKDEKRFEKLRSGRLRAEEYVYIFKNL